MKKAVMSVMTTQGNKKKSTGKKGPSAGKGKASTTKSRPRNKGGRPCILTDDIQEKITSCIKAGNYMETAAIYAGISKFTFYEWLKKGRAAKSGRFKKFSDAVEKALAESEVDDLKKIETAANSDWKAAAWRLERKHPDRWGRRVQVDVDPAGDKSKITRIDELEGSALYLRALVLAEHPEMQDKPGEVKPNDRAGPPPGNGGTNKPLQN